MKPETTAFLKRFYALLQADHWGDIDSHWFNPDSIILEEGEEGGEEYQWAKELQEAVEKALEADGQKKISQNHKHSEGQSQSSVSGG